MAARKKIDLTTVDNADLPEAYLLLPTATAEERAAWCERTTTLIETMAGLDRVVITHMEPETGGIFLSTVPRLV